MRSVSSQPIEKGRCRWSRAVSLRTRLVLVVATAVAGAVVLASGLVYYLIRNELLNQVNRSLRAQAEQIASSPSRGLATQVPGHPKQYILHFRGLPFSNPFQFVDAAGATYRPEQGFGDVWAPSYGGTQLWRREL